MKWFVMAVLLAVTAGARPEALALDPAPLPSKPAEALYLQLHSVELDPTRVYEVRNAAVDYPKLHITLDDGKIGFTTDVFGNVTGAFFEGDGELLIVPPDQAER